MGRGKQINQKCVDCANYTKTDAGYHQRDLLRKAFFKNKPSCWVKSCSRKRSYYRNLEENRKKQREAHRYIKYCGNYCALCQSEGNLEVHHVKPQSKGGEDSWTNVITLCSECHSLISKYYSAVGWH